MRLAAILLAVALAAPASAKPKSEPLGPFCGLPAAAMAMADADGLGGATERRDGDRAAKLIAALNKVGEPSSYTARSLVIRTLGDRVIVLIFDPCLTARITVEAETFKALLREVDGDRV